MANINFYSIRIFAWKKMLFVHFLKAMLPPISPFWIIKFYFFYHFCFLDNSVITKIVLISPANFSFNHLGFFKMTTPRWHFFLNFNKDFYRKISFSKFIKEFLKSNYYYFFLSFNFNNTQYEKFESLSLIFKFWEDKETMLNGLYYLKSIESI